MYIVASKPPLGLNWSFRNSYKDWKSSQWLTFIQQLKENYKLSKFSFIFYYLATIQLLKEGGCKKLNITISFLHAYTFHSWSTYNQNFSSYLYVFLKDSFNNQFFFLRFNYGTNMALDNINESILIKIWFFPWHFYNPNLLKLVININYNFKKFFGQKGTSIFNICDIKIFKHGIHILDLRWRRMLFKGIMMVFLLA